MPADQNLDVREFARNHHVHYDVLPEETLGGDARRTVGFDVRLFASHERENLGQPGCASCLELLNELRRFAEQIVREVEPAPSVQIVAEPSALYESREEGGRDEVALTIRVGPLAASRRDADAAIAAFREQLDGVVPRQG